MRSTVWRPNVMLPDAIAVRADTGLADTSTIFAEPSAAIWLSCSGKFTSSSLPAPHSRHISPADGDHLAARLIIFPEVVLLRFSFNHVQDELSELGIAGSRPERSQDVEL